MRPPASSGSSPRSSIRDDLQPRHLLEVLPVPGEKGCSNFDGGGIDQQIHGRDLRPSPLKPCEKSPVDRRKPVAGRDDLQGLGDAGDALTSRRRISSKLRSRGKLAQDEYRGSEGFARVRFEESRRRPSFPPVSFTEEVDKERRVDVDQSFGARAGDAFRPRTTDSTAARVSGRRGLALPAARRSFAVLPGAKWSLITCENDRPGVFRRERSS